MSEYTTIWLFAAFGGWNIILSGAVLSLIVSQVKTNFAVNLFINSLGEKMAKALHAHDDHLHIDELLDKYIDPNHEMTQEECTRLKDICNGLLENEMVSQVERGQAGTMAAICEYMLETKFLKPKGKLKTP